MRKLGDRSGEIGPGDIGLKRPLGFDGALRLAAGASPVDTSSVLGSNQALKNPETSSEVQVQGADDQPGRRLNILQRIVADEAAFRISVGGGMIIGDLAYFLLKAKIEGNMAFFTTREWVAAIIIGLVARGVLYNLNYEKKAEEKFSLAS